MSSDFPLQTISTILMEGEAGSMGEVPDEDNFVLSRIRLKVSSEAATSRIQQRSTTFNANRPGYDKIVKQNTVPSFDDFKKLCHYFQRDKKLRDLEPIRRALASDQKYRDIFMAYEKSLYTLTGCLTGCNTRLQTESFQCLVNLGMGSEVQCAKLCKKVGSYLITCFAGNNAHIQGLCCWVIGNLCGDHPSVCLLLKSQGLESALSAVLASIHHSVVLWACYAMNQYLHTVPQRIWPVCHQPEILKKLLVPLSWSDEDLGDPCWCLFIVSTVPQVCSTLVNFGVVAGWHSALISRISKQPLDLKMATALVRLLTNCIGALPELSIEVCYRADQFSTVVKHLLQSPCHSLQKETLQLLANLVKAAKTHSGTGTDVLEDSNLKRNLEPSLRQILSSEFQFYQTSDSKFFDSQVLFGMGPNLIH